MIGQVFNLHRGDAVEYLRGLPDESIDLVVTDPAYESLEKHRAKGTTTRLKQSKASSNEWFEIFPNARFPEFFAEVYRVLKRDTHFYMYCDQETGFLTKPIGEAAGFKFWKAIIWDKVSIGMGYHYRARHEWIMFFEKGKRKLNNLGVPDIIEAKRVMKGYPTEKPVAVSSVLVAQSTGQGDWICDPFAGSGSVGVAAVRSGRNFAGNDLAADSIALAQQRLEAEGARSGTLPNGAQPQARLL